MAASLSRGWARLLILPLALAAGCDALTAKPFTGSIIEMDILGTPAPSKPHEHIELWASNQYGDTVRINFFYDEARFLTTYGLQFRPALDPADPCMIDSQGNLVWTAAAYPKSVTIAGVTQTPDEQALQVINRIRQVNGANSCFKGMINGVVVCGQQATSLYAIVPFYDDQLAPRPDADADPAVPAKTRLADCEAYWGRTTASIQKCQNNNQPISQCDENPLAYSGNPPQISAPSHGYFYGTLEYTEQHPPTGFSSARFDTPISLAGIQELWMTTETVPIAMVDPLHRGPIFLDGKPSIGGRNTLHFTMPPRNGAHGFASVLYNLDQASSQF